MDIYLEQNCQVYVKSYRGLCIHRLLVDLTFLNICMICKEYYNWLDISNNMVNFSNLAVSMLSLVTGVQTGVLWAPCHKPAQVGHPTYMCAHNSGACQ